MSWGFTWREQIIPPIRREAHGRRTNVKLQARCFPSLPSLRLFVDLKPTALGFLSFWFSACFLSRSSLTSLLPHTFLRGELEGVPGKIWPYFPWSALTLLSLSSQAKLGLLVHRLAHFPDLNVHLFCAMRLSLTQGPRPEILNTYFQDSRSLHKNVPVSWWARLPLLQNWPKSLI